MEEEEEEDEEDEAGGGKRKRKKQVKKKTAKTAVKKKKKKQKRVGLPPSAGHGAGSHVIGEVALLPLGMAAPPTVEYALTGGHEAKGKELHVRYFLPATIHG